MESIVQDFEWLKKYAADVAKNFESFSADSKTIDLPEPPLIISATDHYAGFLEDAQLNKYERLALVLALSPHLSHNFLQILNLKGNPALLRQNDNSGALMPTGETFLFLASAGQENEKLKFHSILGTSHQFYKKSILDLEVTESYFPSSYGILAVSPSHKDLFLYNRFSKPRYNAGFPAHLLETNLTWADLVLNDFTRKSLEEIKTFVTHETKLRREVGGNHMKPGYRALFYGASGTGKTLAVTLLGKELNRDVYRVDLSMVISKYIGETSKNLNALFNTAEDKGWILFFDEGDAVFSRRSEAGSGEDKNAKHANQDTAFLLQRIENYNGLVIVATNYRQNMDSAFTRRFQCIINFSLPDQNNRLRLWKENMPEMLPYAPDISLDQIAGTYHLSAASIIKIIQRASLKSIQSNESQIPRSILEFCIKDEEFNNK